MTHWTFTATLAAALASGGFAAMPALAGGMTTPAAEPMVAPAPAPVVMAPNGDWTGLYVGGQLGFGDVGSSSATLDGDGMTGGLLAGYRRDFGQFVAGVEANFDWANIDLGAGTDSLDNITRLKVIGGYDMGQTLVYGTIAAVGAEATVGGAALNDTGWGAGIGVDYALTDRMTLGAEVMEHRFSNFSGTGVDLDATTLNARIGFQF